MPEFAVVTVMDDVIENEIMIMDECVSLKLRCSCELCNRCWSSIED